MKYPSTYILVLFLLVPIFGLQTGCWFWSGGQDEKSSKSLSTIDPVNYLKTGGEFWAVIKVNGVLIGYQQTEIRLLANEESAETSSPTRYQVVQNVGVNISSGGVPVSMKWTLTSNEQTDGLFISAAKEEFLSKKSSKMVYLPKDGVINKMTESTDQNPFETSVPAEPDGLAPNALMFSLMQKPMRIGETRSLKFYDLMVENYADVELTASKVEQIDIFQNQSNLLRIDGKIRFDRNSTIPCIYWMDATGHIVKSEIDQPGNKWEILIAGPSEAKSIMETPQEFDTNKLTLVPVRGMLQNPFHTKRVDYRVQLKNPPSSQSGMSLEKLLPTSKTQTVQIVNPQTAEVSVSVLQTDLVANPHTTENDIFVEDDCLPNKWIQSQNTIITTKAQEAAPKDMLPLALADSLQKYVYTNMKKSESETAFSSAAETAFSMTGGSAEYAVFLAALARARGIPTRVVVGMIYTPTESGMPVMRFHFWNILFLDGHWIPVDATLESGGWDAARITLASSNLTSDSLETFLRPVFFSTNNIQVEIISSE